VKYLYNYKHLYPVGEGQEDVKELTLECYDIEPANRNLIGGSQWEFKVVGRGDQLFRTSYDWALVEDTAETFALIAEYEELHRQRTVLLWKAVEVFGRVKRFATTTKEGNETS
jgi:hypothetical protein